MGCPPDLLFTLTLRGGIGRFAVVKTARGHFPQLAVDCRPELSDQHHAAVGLERDHDHRRRVAYDRHLVLAAVRKPLLSTSTENTRPVNTIGIDPRSNQITRATPG